MIRLTIAQAQAASNACDLIRDSLEADDKKREAALYGRASAVLEQGASALMRSPVRHSPRRHKRKPHILRLTQDMSSDMLPHDMWIDPSGYKLTVLPEHAARMNPDGLIKIIKSLGSDLA